MFSPRRPPPTALPPPPSETSPFLPAILAQITCGMLFLVLLAWAIARTLT